MKYYVTWSIVGRYIAEVEAEDEREAREKSLEKFWGASFGELKDIDGYPVIVEDERGDFVWEK